MALQVAANLTTMFPERGPLISRYAAAKAAGFKVVEVSLPYSETTQRLAAELAKNGLRQIMINSDPGVYHCHPLPPPNPSDPTPPPPGNIEGGDMGCACIPGKEATFKDSLDKSICYAKALDVPMIHIMVGKFDKNHTEEEHARVLEKNLRYAAHLLSQEGIVGLIEPKNALTFPGYFLSDYDTAVALIFKIDSPSLRLLLDIFHLQYISGNITRNIERLMPYTAHVQVSQPPNRTEPLSPGELNFAYVFQKLKTEGYKGFIGAEYVPSTKKTEDSLDWIKTCGLTF